MGTFVTALAISLLVSHKVWALPCALFCESDKGIVNWQFFGDSANEYFFQPSIDKAGEKFDALGKKYSEILNDTLKQRIKDLDQISKDRLKDFSSILDGKLSVAGRLTDEKLSLLDGVLRGATTDAIKQLDQTLKGALEDLDQKSTGQVAQLLGGLDSNQTNLTRMTVWVVAFLGIILLVVATYFVGFSSHANKRKLAALIGTGATICAAIVFAGNRIIEADSRAIAKPLVQAFEQARRDGDLSYGLALALRLKDNPSNPSWQRYAYEAGKLSLLRQYFFRATSLWEKHETQVYIEAILKQLNQASENENSPDAELFAVLSEVIATHGDTRTAHYISAVLALNALQSLEHQSTNSSYFGVDPRRAAVYVLRAYLQFPLSDSQVRDLIGAEIGSTIGLKAKLGTPALATLKAAAERFGDVTLSPRQVLFLKTRQLAIETHFAYTRVLIAIADLESSVHDYPLPSARQEIAFLHALKVKENWDKLVDSTEYRNATLVDRMIIMQAPYATIQRLDDFIHTYQSKSIAIRISCEGKFAVMRKAWFAYKYLTTSGGVEINSLMQMGQHLQRERLLEPTQIAVLYAAESTKLRSSLSRLLSFETQFLFALAQINGSSEEDPGGCSMRNNSQDMGFGTSGPSPDGMAGYDNRDPKPIYNLMAEASALGLVICNDRGRIACPDEISWDGGVLFVSAISSFASSNHTGQEFLRQATEFGLANAAALVDPIR